MTTVLSDSSLQRVGFLVVLPQLLTEFGLDPSRVLEESGITLQALSHPNNTIPYRAMGRMLEACAEVTHCPYFGLEVGKRMNLPLLGPIGLLMRNAPTLREALQDFAAHQHRNSHGGVVYFIEQKGLALFGYAVYQADTPGAAIITDGVAVAAWNIVRELVGTNPNPILSVLLPRSEPEDMEPYFRTLTSTLEFASGQTAVRLSKKLLDQPIAGADAERRVAILAEVNDMWNAGDLNLQERMRRHVRVALMQQNFSNLQIATEMGISVRTLNRRLAEAGLTFRQVLDEARCVYVKQLFTLTALETSQIALMAGYANAGSLSLAFYRWTGQKPAAWRASRRLAGNGANS